MMDKLYTLFTHDDLDGYGCRLVAEHWFGHANVDVVHCTNNNRNDVINEYLDQREADDDMPARIFITDISTNEATADRLAALNHETHVYLIDHHKSADWMNKYDFAHVDVVHDDHNWASGTSLLLDFLAINFNDHTKIGGPDDTLVTKEQLTEFAETVRQWDTWDWKRLNNTKPRELNSLFVLMGHDMFLSRFQKSVDLNWMKTERLLLNVEDERVDATIERMDNSKVMTPIEGYSAYVVVAHEYLSEGMNRLHEDYPEVDLVACVNFMEQSLSFRTIHDHVDCSKIAKAFGGGGHPKAAGAPIPQGTSEVLIDTVFSP